MTSTSLPRMQAAILPGGRLHLHDGPIDLIITAEGARDAVRSAYVAATRRFATILDELCSELPLLRASMARDAPVPNSPVARRMDAAVRPLCDGRFITRMAAVAGSVADEVLEAMVAAAPLSRAWVNNGGDIAVHLSPGAVFDVAMAGGLRDTRRALSPYPEALAQQASRNPHPEELAQQASRNPHPEELAQQASRRMLSHQTTVQSFETQPPAAPQDEGFIYERPSLFGTLRITHADAIRGIATSGFGGRSFSLGIADAVTILARDAASADAAATLVANAVDLPGQPAIHRAPATDFDPQSDLGGRCVTRHVGELSVDEMGVALDAGACEARRLQDQGHLASAALSLRGHARIVTAMTPRTQRLASI